MGDFFPLFFLISHIFKKMICPRCKFIILSSLTIKLEASLLQGGYLCWPHPKRVSGQRTERLPSLFCAAKTNKQNTTLPQDIKRISRFILK